MKPNHIKAARAWLSLTQQQLADKAGIHAKAVAYWERKPPGEKLNGHAPDAIQKALSVSGVRFEDGRMVL